MKDILKYLCTWKFWKELLIMTLGMAIAAAAVYYFMMPSKLVLGSISGLSIVITNVLNMVASPSRCPGSSRPSTPSSWSWPGS